MNTKSEGEDMNSKTKHGEDGDSLAGSLEPSIPTLGVGMDGGGFGSGHMCAQIEEVKRAKKAASETANRSPLTGSSGLWLKGVESGKYSTGMLQLYFPFGNTIEHSARMLQLLHFACVLFNNKNRE